MPTPVDQTSSIITIPYRVNLAGDKIGDIAANSYVAIGMGGGWTSNIIPTPTNSTDYYNNSCRNLVAIKKVYISDSCFVVQRVDWTANTYYNAYANGVDMFATSVMDNANGLATAVTGNLQITGSNTTFRLDFSNNSLITLPGDGIYTLPQTREVINVASNTLIIVNNAFTSTYTNNVAEKTINYAPNYSRNFYVRNSYDQVFACLSNNNGIASTDMPKISLGGQLPSNPYIIAADGYLWKYLYTIPAGYKQNFFTSQWMPVLEDPVVQEASVPGRIDIVNIVNGGIGYNDSVANFNAPILTVTGDGTGANLTAQVDANGTIYGVNILNGGSGYTIAEITANVDTTGANANLQPVISPRYGWGSNAALELGSTAVMVSVELDDTENGTIPTVDFWGNYFSYGQILLIDSPLYTANNLVANLTNYDMTTVIQCSSVLQFNMGDIAFQGPNNNIQYATFQGTVVWFDESTNELHLNNTSGTFSQQDTIYDYNNGNAIVAFGIVPPEIDIFSGNIDFIENRKGVTRSPGQIENIKIVLQF